MNTPTMSATNTATADESKNGRPIDAAAKSGRPVQLYCETHPHYGWHTMSWSARNGRWEGYRFGMMGRRRIWWDENAAQPTHYKPVAQELPQ